MHPKVPVAVDPNLTAWVRDTHNPIVFADSSPPCSFPGAIWRSTAGGSVHWNLLCEPRGGRGWARYSTTDPTLHGPWALQDKAFATDKDGRTVGGCSGPGFLPLPSPRPGEPTHVISNGCQHPITYSAGIYDQEAEHLNITSHISLDVGPSFGWPAAGLANASDGDGARVLVVGWVTPGRHHPQDPRCPKVAGISICGVQAMSAIRTLAWDRGLGRLVTAPVREYESLRNATLLTWDNRSPQSHWPLDH